MKFTLSWLKEFLDTKASLDTIVETLTAIGLEVEDVQDMAAELTPFTVAEIMKAEPHPDADRLQVCKVLTMAGERQIVCGAPNARAGIKVALADIGAVIPNGGFKIKASKIRGVESHGMLCSAKELGLGEDHAGIMELPEDAQIGASIVGVLGLDDPLIEIQITPDRGDCLGIYGIARDLAAAGLGTLAPLPETTVKGQGDAGRTIQLKTEDCKLFVGRRISGVTNGDSPDWLKKRLTSIGLRPISALVDVTNYMTVVYGRPLHVYDAAKLQGDIVVRTSRKGEAFDALNDKHYELPDGLCTISDEKDTFHGLGGVVGGEESGCTESTTDVFLEAAWFEPLAVAKTGRALNIDSDARYRFERTVDPEFVAKGAEIATNLILEFCGGEASELVSVGKAPNLVRDISFNSQVLTTLGGVELPEKECKDILSSLGFTVKADGKQWVVRNPSWRPDMEQAADIVEEILRIKRYDVIPEASLPPVAVTEDERSARLGTVRRALVSRGMDETYHFAFIDDKQAARFAADHETVTVINPISSEMDTLRPSLIAGLLAALGRNMGRAAADAGLFEVGTVFHGVKADQQPLMVAGVRLGHQPAHWSGKPRAMDTYDVKADAEQVLAACGLTTRVQVNTAVPGWYHPGKSGCLCLGPKNVLGYFGAVHPAILRAFDIDKDVFAFEVMLDAIPVRKAKASAEALMLSEYQATRRDFAFVVDDSVPADALLSAVKGAEKKLVRDVTLFDVYAGKGVPEGKKSLAISVTLQADDRTLSEEDITVVSDAIIDAAAKQGGELR